MRNVQSRIAASGKELDMADKSERWVGAGADAARSAVALLLCVPALGVLSACRPDSGLQKVNSEPEAQITAPAEGSALLAGTAVTLRGAASDANHDASELRTRWFVGEDEACASTAPEADGTTTCEVIVLDADELSARLEVVDPDGAVGTANAAWAVTPNAAPEVQISSPTEDGVYYSDQLVILRASVSDTEDAPEALVVRWTSTLDGALGDATANSEGLVESFVNLREGAHAVQAFVTDSAGNEAQSTVLIDVGPPNSAPDCAITAPDDGSAGESGSTVTFRGTVSDVDVPADRLSVSWTSDKDGPLGSSAPTSGGSVTFPYADLSIDTHVVTMQVTDEVGATCTAEVVYTVGSPPTIDLENPTTGEVVNEGEAVTFTALVSDGEDVPGDLWVTWESSLDGLLYEGPPDSSGLAEFRDSALSRGDHALTATVTDTAGLYATARTTFTVNGVPSAPGVSITPSSPYTDDDLRVTISSASVDPEGDAVSYAYAWSVDGAPSSASTSSTLPASATTRGQVWGVSVTATDGLGTSGAGAASVTIGNTAPSLSSLSLTPDPAYEDDVLVCTAGGTTDADGDAVGLNYEWYVDGAALGYDSDTLDSARFDRGEAVYCTATPTDGTDDGTTRTSNTVTIENSAPSVATVSISPASPTAASTLTCAYAGFDDADGDTDRSTYAWTVDGVTVGTGSTLSGAFVGGDVVTCTVTPYDGTDAGSAVSGSVTVGNTAPVLASVVLSPDPAYEADTLRCTPGSVTDADGTASFGYAYAWTVNGAAIGATTSTLTGASFSAGDDVSCAVTASDGAASSASVSSGTVTIANTAPVMASVSVSPSTGRVGDTLTCSAGATDADGAVTYSYAWSNGAVGASLTLTASDNPGDVRTCTATATDSAGATATGTASATVSNTNPVLASVAVSPSTGRVGDVLTCSGSATDADGGTPSLSYAWSTGATTAAITLTAANDPGDVLTCTVSATDADGGTASGSASGSVSNTAPVLGTVSISPGTAYNDDLLTCSGSATDADGGTPTLSYAWTDTTRGTSVGSGATLSLTSALAGSRDTIACAVTATDTSGGSASGSASITLGNRAPVVTASLTPSSPTRASTLTCSGSATDADADSTTLSFTWTVDGASVTASSSSPTLSTLAGVFAAGQLVACTVSATDGKTGTDSDSASVVIDNVAPVVSSVTLPPGTVYTNDTLTASVSASDADGDGLSYTYDWYVDGALVQSSASNTLSGTSYFDRDEVVYVTATASDGVDAASGTSASVTVSNTAPSAPVVEVSAEVYAALGSTSAYADLNQPYMYADIVYAERDGVLDSFGVYGSSSTCGSVDFFVLSSSTATTGAWTLEWSASATFASSVGYQTAGDVGVSVSAGRYYAFGWATTCSSGVRFYYGLSSLPTDAGFGTATGYFGQSYSGYSTLTGSLTYYSVYAAPQAMEAFFTPDQIQEGDDLTCNVIGES
jgi:hypothetical protein